MVYAPDSQIYADEIAKAVENGIIGGWQYAPSGMEGLVMILEVGSSLEYLIEMIDVGIVRWLKVSIGSYCAVDTHRNTDGYLVEYRSRSFSGISSSALSILYSSTISQLADTSYSPSSY